MEVHDERVPEETFGACLDALPQVCVEVLLERDGRLLVARRTNEPRAKRAVSESSISNDSLCPTHRLKSDERRFPERSQVRVFEVLVAVVVEVGVVDGDEPAVVVLVVEFDGRVGVALTDAVGDVNGVS